MCKILSFCVLKSIYFIIPITLAEIIFVSVVNPYLEVTSSRIVIGSTLSHSSTRDLQIGIHYQFAWKISKTQCCKVTTLT